MAKLAKIADDHAGNGQIPESWLRSKSEIDRLAWLFKIRPQVLAEFIGQLLAGQQRRRMVETPDGIHLYLDPLTGLGRNILKNGIFEPQTRSIFDKFIKPGFTVLDIGANEGYFSILAAKLAGHSGFVVSVEPQDRIIPVLERNLVENCITNAVVVKAAMGDADGTGEMFLATTMNSGASGLVRKFRWTGKRQATVIVTPTVLMKKLNIERFDFVKVDVEGYEDRVVGGLMPLIVAGKLGALLVDFHHSILAANGSGAADIHEKIVGGGMRETECCAGNYKLYSL